MVTGPTRSLLLVHDARFMDPADFEEIARRIGLRAPDIWARAVNNEAEHRTLARRMAALPSLTVCPFPLANFRPLRGPVYQGIRLSKITQLEHFAAAGVPVPKWVAVEETSELDPAEWGPVVVVKPEFGLRGQAVRLVPTARVGAHLASLARRYRLRQGELMIAQAFIDTGPRPSTYRVLTLFGQPLYAKLDTRKAADVPSSFADLPDEGLEFAVNRDTLRDRAFDASPDVLDLARRAHRALDDVPVLGIDIVREKATGDLSVLEANPNGTVWHLSSPTGRKGQARYGMDNYAQFGALDRATEVLIARTRTHAA